MGRFVNDLHYFKEVAIIVLYLRQASIMDDFEEYTSNAQHHQLETLRYILRHNHSVHYLQPFLSSFKGGGDIFLDDPATFKSVVPLSSYEDYADYTNQMADDGKQDPFLSVDPLLCFFYSSGTTTMKPKLIPYFDSKPRTAAIHLAIRSTIAVFQRLFPPRPEVNKILWFLYADNTVTAKCGLKVMTASSYIFLDDKTPFEGFAIYSSPPEVFIGFHVEHQMYCHLLCGLRNLDVIDGMAAPYAIGLIQALALLESKWEQLCHDIEIGFPSDEISEVPMREAVIKTLGGPQPELANKLRSICEGKNWGGIVPRIWPNIRYIKCVSTGCMKLYYPKLKYYAGDVPVLGGEYFSSECCVGINVDIMQPPETTRYVIVPTAAYYEFLPFDMDENENKSNDVAEETMDLCSVEVGKLYEVVVTTHGGLYRYRLGDIVRVVGFYNSSPQLEFVMKAPKSTAEIVTEKDLFSAIKKFQLALRGAMRSEIVDFASFLDQESSPKHLKVFVEVKEKSEFIEESDLIFKRFIPSLESGLGALYKAQRDKGHIGNLLILILRSGAFYQLSEFAIKNGTPASQYKPPKIIRNQEIVKLLEKLTVVTVSLDGK